MMTHEFDAYMDAQAFEPQDDSLLFMEHERDHDHLQEVKHTIDWSLYPACDLAGDLERDLKGFGGDPNYARRYVIY